MTLSDYLILVTVAKYKSLTMAADTLHMTKSAVSYSLAKTEKNLGLPLFNRSTKSVNLTSYGKQLLPYAQAVLRKDEQFNDQIRGLKEMQSGEVRIGTCSSICSNWIPDIVALFRASNPNITIHVRGGASNQNIIEWLVENEIDIGIGTSEPNPMLDIEKLYSDEMICITPIQFQVENENYITAKELGKYPLLSQEYPFNEEILQVLEALSVNPQSYITGYDDATLIAMTESNLGYTIQGKLVMKRVSAAVKVYSFEEKQYRHFSILTKHGIQKSFATKKMCQIIRNYAKDYPQDYELDLLFLPNTYDDASG